MLAIITHPSFQWHDTGPGHPENSRRLDVLNNQLIASGMDYIAQYHDAPAATDDQICRVHSEAHLRAVRNAVPTDGYKAIDEDTIVSSSSLDAALHAAGAAILGAELLLKGKNNPVFCAVRPPGHHAGPSRAEGFCLFNSVAVAAAHAIEKFGLDRIAIVDFDAHHGNGTEDIFAGDERILYLSSFQHPFYPHSGIPPKASNILSLPLAAGSGGDEFRQGVTAEWLEPLAAYDPELVIFSAGFDGHVFDEMSELMLTEQDFAWITAEIRKATRASTNDRYLSVLEGGYNPEATARSVVAHLKAFYD